MTSLEILGRSSLFFTGLIFMGGAIILPISTLMSEQILQDSGFHEFGTAVVRPCFCIYLALLGVSGVFSSIAYCKSTTPRQMVGNLTICLILGILLLGLSLSNFRSAANRLEKKLTRSQPLYYWGLTGPISNEVKDATDIWDRLQTEMKCCGVHSPEDWSGFAPKKYPTTVPISCYDLEEPMQSSVTPSGIGYDDHQPPNDMTVMVYGEGCATKLKKVHFVSLGVLIVVICFSLFLDLLFMVIMACTKAEEETQNSRKVAMENCAYPTKLGGLNNVKPVVFEGIE